VAFGNNPTSYNILFLGWFVFYYAGLEFRNRVGFGSQMKVKKQYIIAAFLACCLEGVVLSAVGLNEKFACNQMKLSSQVFALLIAIYFMQKKQRGEQGCIEEMMASLGNCSYGIFFVHIIIMTVCQFLLDRLLPNAWWLLDYLGIVFLTIIISWTMVGMAQKYIRSSKVKRAIGME